MSFSIDVPPNSRLFVVAGRNTSGDYLRTVFEQYGEVTFVKYLRDKGVAYVKYDRASSAALAIENLHEVTLNDGHGPRLKVMLADSPHTRFIPGMQQRTSEEDSQLDPDNTPPRSRLFLVVPKNADGSIIQTEMSRFPGMQYCKTDLIASKGIVFVKYSTSSSAYLAMETILSTGILAGYRVKVMLADPKTRRIDSSGILNILGDPINSLPATIPGSFTASPAVTTGGMLPTLGPSLFGIHQGISSLQSNIGSLSGSFGQGLSTLGNHNTALGGPLGQTDISVLAGQQALMGGNAFNVGLGGLTTDDYAMMNSLGSGGGGLAGFSTPMLSNPVTSNSLLGSLDTVSSSSSIGIPSTPSVNNDNATRLFIVVHKSVNEESLAPLFRCYPGMEYLDLKRDRATGRSKGYGYVNYQTPEAAAAAQGQLNGIEYPPGSHCQLKVLFAEPLGGVRSRSEEVAAAAAAAAESFPSAAVRLLGTPSNDTASTTFQLPSPNSGESSARANTVNQQQQHSARTDISSLSHDSILSPRSASLGLGGDSLPLLDSATTTVGSVSSVPDIAAMQASLGALNLGTTIGNGHGHIHSAGPNSARQLHSSRTSPPSLSRDSVGAMSDNELSAGGSWRETSPEALSALSPAASPGRSLPGPGDPSVVYSALQRPLPDYALAPVFKRCGPVEYVRVLAEEGVVVVKYCTPEAAALAVGSLNGAEVLGEVLQVRSSPPLASRAPGSVSTGGLRSPSV